MHFHKVGEFFKGGIVFVHKVYGRFLSQLLPHLYKAARVFDIAVGEYSFPFSLHVSIMNHDNQYFRSDTIGDSSKSTGHISSMTVVALFIYMCTITIRRKRTWSILCSSWYYQEQSLCRSQSFCILVRGSYRGGGPGISPQN